MDVAAICALSSANYDSADRQREFQLELDNLRLPTFMAESEITEESVCLYKFWAYIDKLNLRYVSMYSNET